MSATSGGRSGGTIRQRDVATRVLAKLVLAALAFVVIVVTWHELQPLAGQAIIAAFLAVAIDTVVRWLQRHHLSRAMAILATLLVIGATVLFTVLVFVVPVVRSARRLADAAPDIVRELQAADGWRWLVAHTSIEDSLLAYLGDLAASIPPAVIDLISNMVGGIFGLVNMTLMVIFLVTGGGRALELAVRIWPGLVRSGPWDVVTGAYANIGHYLVGATVQATLAGSALTLMLLLVGTPHAVVLGFIMFLLDFVPLVGATIGAVPAVAVALVDGGIVDALIVTAFIIVYQQVENAWIQPKIQGHVVHLPLIAIFFSVMIGGQLFGVAGALLAVPVASVLAIIVRQWFEVSGRDHVVVPRVFDDEGMLIRSGGDGS